MSDTATLNLERSHYTLEQVEKGLHALATLGTGSKASEVTGIPERTLQSWRSVHADRYHQIRQEVLPAIHARMAVDSEDLALEWAALERRGLTDLQDTWDELKPADKSAALRNATVSRGISVDKALLLRGQPTSIVKHDVSADIRALVTAGIADVVEGTAEEVQGQTS